MKPARPSTVLLAAVLTAALGWFLLDLWSDGGGSRLPLPWPAAIGPLVVAAVVLLLARDVRRSVRGERPSGRPMDPIAAARVAVLAKASAYAGGILVGWYAAQALVLFSSLASGRREPLLVAGAIALASAVLAVAGLVAQRWCRLPPDDESGTSETDSSTDGARPPRHHG